MVQKRVSRFELSNRLRDVKLLSLDVDGILTDGGLYFADDGNTFRKFNVKDGLGIKLALKAGIVVVVISAGIQDSIRLRMESLGISHIYTSVDDKLEILGNICGELGIDPSQVIHMGDDLNDLPILEAVGCPISVPNAMPDVRDAAIYVTAQKGGEGAVREVCDMLVAARR